MLSFFKQVELMLEYNIYIYSNSDNLALRTFYNI